MHRNDDRPALFVPKFNVASPLADLLEAGTTWCSHHVLSGDDGESLAHAAMSTGTMIGGSAKSGTGASSKYNSSASRRLPSASSTVLPWLTTSTSRHRATYQGASCVMAAVKRIIPF